MPATARRALAVAVLVVAVTPFLVALVAAHHDGWRPLGDDAVVEVFTHDVFSPRTPLVGMPTTLGPTASALNANHPGPLEFWILAPFDRALGSRLGILLGVAVVNAVALLTVGIVTYNLAGARAAAGALAVGVVLAWGLGRQIVVDPWNPYIALFALLALCTTAWAAVAGRQWALWMVALLASFVTQQHVLYAPLAAALFALATLGLTQAMYRRHRRGALRARDVVVTTASTAGVLVVAWSFPLFDQLAHDPGNFVALDRSYRAATEPRVGLGYALRVAVQAVGAPPLFARRSDAISRLGGPWSQLGLVVIVTALLVIAALVAGTLLALRRRDRVAAAAGATAVVALVVSTAAVARLPVSFPDIARYRLLQLWVVGGFVWIATGIVVGHALAAAQARRQLRAPALSRAGRVACVTAIAIVLIAAPIAIAFANSNARDDTRLYSEVGRLAAVVAPELHHHPYTLEINTDIGLVGLDVGYGLFEALDRRGIDVRVPRDDLYLARAHSEPRAADRLHVVVGRHAVSSWPSSRGRQVVRDDLATPGDYDRLRVDTDRLREFLRRRSNLTAKGRAALATHAADAVSLTQLLDGTADPIAMYDDARLGRLWAMGLVRSDLFQTREIKNVVEDRRTVNNLVFAVYLDT